MEEGKSRGTFGGRHTWHSGLAVVGEELGKIILTSIQGRSPCENMSTHANGSLSYSLTVQSGALWVYHGYSSLVGRYKATSSTQS